MSPIETELVQRWDLGMTLGECATWDERRQRFYWTDIEQGDLYHLDWGADVPVRHELPNRLASFGLTETPDILLAAFDYGLAWLDLRDLSFTDILRVEDDRNDTRLNDGRMDRQGRFWVGSMFNEVKADTVGEGRLYRFDPDGTLTVHRDGIVIPNSLAWSPDGTSLYFTDSRSFRIDRYDYDTETGMPSNQQIFATLKPGVHADGSCMDALGGLWNAQWGEGQVVRYAPDGTVSHMIDIDTLEPTCVGLGGPDLDHLLVVTASLGGHSNLRESTGNGSAYLFKTNVSGLTEPKFGGTPPA